ncbi:MbeB family mobilization protein [Escherichia coli]|uniref:MbeB family mobilization protein n=1 Tax=Escherichia coli TaxID=562 RepID=UPI00332A8903
MSKIFDLAQSFEEKSKQQVSDIETRLASVFERHETSISDALKSNETKISGAINAQNRRIRALLLKTWLWVGLSLIAVLTASYGVIWLQGEIIAKNWQTISQQKETIQHLEAKGGKIQMSTCGDKKRLCVKIDLDAGSFGDEQESKRRVYPWRIPEGY